MMTRGASKDTVLSRAQFITFNYDRTLEHFLTFAMKDYFGITRKEAAEFVDAATIVHPYGTVGKLDPARDIRSRTRFGFVDDRDVISRVEGILTYSEEMKDAGIRDKVFEAVYEAEVIVFLGFAFHEQNVRLLLLPEEARGQNKRIFATAYNISPPDCDAIAQSIAGFLSSEIRNIFISEIRNRIHDNLTCVRLLEYYSKTLST
jgi:SIR2-like protein